MNSLGIFEPKPFEEIPDEDWRRFFDVNVLSGIRLSARLSPRHEASATGAASSSSAARARFRFPPR